MTFGEDRSDKSERHRDAAYARWGEGKVGRATRKTKERVADGASGLLGGLKSLIPGVGRRRR